MPLPRSPSSPPSATARPPDHLADRRRSSPAGEAHEAPPRRRFPSRSRATAVAGKPKLPSRRTRLRPLKHRAARATAPAHAVFHRAGFSSSQACRSPPLRRAASLRSTVPPPFAAPAPRATCSARSRAGVRAAPPVSACRVPLLLPVCRSPLPCAVPVVRHVRAKPRRLSHQPCRVHPLSVPAKPCAIAITSTALFARFHSTTVPL